VSALLVRQDALREAGREDDAATLAERWWRPPEEWELERRTRTKSLSQEIRDYVEFEMARPPQRPGPLLVSPKVYAQLQRDLAR
jgi:hypothetical protein